MESLVCDKGGALLKFVFGCHGCSVSDITNILWCAALKWFC